MWLDGDGVGPASAAGREFAPAGDLLFFVSPKKSRQKKGDPTGRVPSLRCGQPAMLGRGAVLRNSLRAGALRSNSRSKSVHEAWACSAPHARPTPCASRHGQRGVQLQPGPSLRSAPVLAFARAERSDGPCGFSTPLRLRLRRGACGVARAAQHARASSTGSRGLFERRERSERSEFHRAPRKRCGAGLPRSEAQGSQTWGRFLLPPFLVRTRKGGAPPGAHPGQRGLAESAMKQTTSTIPTPESPSPQPSSHRGKGERKAHIAGGGRIARRSFLPHGLLEPGQ